MLVSEVMTKNVVKVAPDLDLSTLRELFTKTGFHHLLVVDGETLVGVISDRDLLRTVSPFVGTLAERHQDRDTLYRKAHQLMSRALIVARPDDDVRTAAFFLVEKKISCLPVVSEDGKLEGIVTWRDLLRGIAVGRK
jgi:acetoin utilization protein AcuB